MKKLLVFISKCFLSAVISLIILSLLSSLYFNPPIAVQQPDGSTNYAYIPNREWSFMLEGYGRGKTDSLGYNNAYYGSLGNPDIVFAGSSHLEGLQVPASSNCVYVLNELFDKDNTPENDFKCFNLGMSGHFFEVTASNYPYIVDRFKGAKYVVIELFNAEFSADVLDGIIEHKYHEPMEKKGTLYETLQRISFLRLMYKKINEAQSANNAAPVAVSAEPGDKNAKISAYTEKMNVILAGISKISADNNITPIILMHERFFENEKGEIELETDADYKKAFKECCEINHIVALDVSADMVIAYNEKSMPSYGFSNSTPGAGHLNQTGHRIVAEAVYNRINEMEGLR